MNLGLSTNGEELTSSVWYSSLEIFILFTDELICSLLSDKISVEFIFSILSSI